MENKPQSAHPYSIDPMENINDINAENAVIGAMILDGSCIPKVFGMINDSDVFTNETNKIIFDAIKSLMDSKIAVDMLTIDREIKRMGRSSDFDSVKLMELPRNIASASHVDEHALMVLQTQISRRLLKTFTDAAHDAMNGDDPDDIIMAVQSEFDAISRQTDFGGSLVMAEMIRKYTPAVENAFKNRDKLSGIPTGLPTLDQMTNGWQPGSMIVVAGRPSQGKTAFGLFTGLNAASCNVPTLLISIEMSEYELYQRAISSRSRLATSLIRAGDIDWGEYESAVTILEKYPFYITCAARNIAKIRAEIIRKKNRGIKLVIIDYLQLLESTGKYNIREQEIAAMSRGLKLLAGELGIPIIVLAQLNRTADGVEPRLGSLRESGAIEQDADMVIFTHRPEKYGQMKTEDGESNVDMCELIVGKHRNGVTGKIRSHINRCMTKFSEHPFNDKPFPPNEPARNFYERETNP